MNKKRVLSGMRPTGKLHLGHLFGAIDNWVAMQNQYQCYYMVADWHALTTDFADTKNILPNSKEMVLDWLACGIDPKKAVIFRQSEVIEHAELNILLGMITPLGWLFRCPTYKEQLGELKDKDLHNFGFLGYPVLQAADILIYKANVVPVGEDQLAHLELTREIVRRFNGLYGDIFPEPQALLTQSKRVPGLDGRKMSKSYGNAITLDEKPETIKQKVMQMFTDPKKIRANDQGHPEGCVVFAFHKLYNTNFLQIENACKEGQTGCVQCKKMLVDLLSAALLPLAQKREELKGQKGFVESVLETGAKSAKELAIKTMEEVRKAVHLK